MKNYVGDTCIASFPDAENGTCDACVRRKNPILRIDFFDLICVYFLIRIYRIDEFGLFSDGSVKSSSI